MQEAEASTERCRQEIFELLEVFLDLVLHDNGSETLSSEAYADLSTLAGDLLPVYGCSLLHSDRALLRGLLLLDKLLSRSEAKSSDYQASVGFLRRIGYDHSTVNFMFGKIITSDLTEYHSLGILSVKLSMSTIPMP